MLLLPPAWDVAGSERSWWKDWQVSDRRLEDVEVGEVGGRVKACEPARWSVVPQVKRCQGGRLTHLDGTGRQTWHRWGAELGDLPGSSQLLLCSLETDAQRGDLTPGTRQSGVFICTNMLTLEQFSNTKKTKSRKTSLFPFNLQLSFRDLSAHRLILWLKLVYWQMTAIQPHFSLWPPPNFQSQLHQQKQVPNVTTDPINLPLNLPSPHSTPTLMKSYDNLTLDNPYIRGAFPFFLLI